MVIDWILLFTIKETIRFVASGPVSAVPGAAGLKLSGETSENSYPLRHRDRSADGRLRCQARIDSRPTGIASSLCGYDVRGVEAGGGPGYTADQYAVSPSARKSHSGRLAECRPTGSRCGHARSGKPHRPGQGGDGSDPARACALSRDWIERDHRTDILKPCLYLSGRGHTRRTRPGQWANVHGTRANRNCRCESAKGKCGFDQTESLNKTPPVPSAYA